MLKRRGFWWTTMGFTRVHLVGVFATESALLTISMGCALFAWETMLEERHMSPAVFALFAVVFALFAIAALLGSILSLMFFAHWKNQAPSEAETEPEKIEHP